jgi:5,10-methenyltetrahydrofolate synthetase
MGTPTEIKEWRRAERARLVALRTAVTEADHRHWSAAITAALIDGFPQINRMTIGLYWPFKGEFDTRYAIHHWRTRGARAALPVVVEKAAPLEFREWWPGAPMTKGVYDLPIPEGTAVVVPQALLIPPIGFDARGYRLGYGGGYFDRTLAALDPKPLRIGVAFEISRIATIHPQPHDIPMDFIVTEAGIHRMTAEGLQPPEQTPATGYASSPFHGCGRAP